jgi:hypothetical protein
VRSPELDDDADQAQISRRAHGQSGITSLTRQSRQQYESENDTLVEGRSGTRRS